MRATETSPGTNLLIIKMYRVTKIYLVCKYYIVCMWLYHVPECLLSLCGKRLKCKIIRVKRQQKLCKFVDHNVSHFRKDFNINLVFVYMLSIKRLCNCAPFRGIEIVISFENNLCLFLFSSAQLYFSQTKGKSLNDCSECLLITSGCQSEHSIASAFLKRTTRHPVCDPVLFVNSHTQQCSRTFL